MSAEEKNTKQDVEIAILAKEIEHMGTNIISLKENMMERFSLLTDEIKVFVEVINNKVDLKVYMEDRRQLGLRLKTMEDNIALNTDFRKDLLSTNKGRQDERKTIFGISQGSISFVISILTLITLSIAVLGPLLK